MRMEFQRLVTGFSVLCGSGLCALGSVFLLLGCKQLHAAAVNVAGVAATLVVAADVRFWHRHVGNHVCMTLTLTALRDWNGNRDMGACQGIPMGKRIPVGEFGRERSPGAPGASGHSQTVITHTMMAMHASALKKCKFFAFYVYLHCTVSLAGMH